MRRLVKYTTKNLTDSRDDVHCARILEIYLRTYALMHLRTYALMHLCTCALRNSLLVASPTFSRRSLSLRGYFFATHEAPRC